MEISRKFYDQTVPGKALTENSSAMCLVFPRATRRTSHLFSGDSKEIFVDISNTHLTLWK